ncbi:MAG: hypothetical protein ABIG64_03590 [Candidatus Omnitrophota bacterium]
MSGPSKFFEENTALFANTTTEAERYNLYQGLVAICNQLNEIERRQRNIESYILDISTKVNRINY